MRAHLCRQVLIAGLVSILFPLSIVRAAELPGAITDQEFWRLVTDLSERGGVFQQEVMSNEDSAQFVIPALKERIRRGGVYIGVGPEQNFTYIAAIQPALAFVVDIRRDNLLEHLLYKALFELSADRADFIARLFSRPRPAGLDAVAGPTALFDAYQSIDVDDRLLRQHLAGRRRPLETRAHVSIERRRRGGHRPPVAGVPHGRSRPI